MISNDAEKFDLNRRRVKWWVAQAIYILSLLGALYCLRVGATEAKGAFTAATLLLIVLAIRAFIYRYEVWRCPSCNKYLGRTFSLKHCPHCGVLLGDSNS